MIRRTLTAIILLGIFSSGCAVGVKHNYHVVNPDFSVATEDKVVIGVQDRRPYILNNDKEPTFVGLQRGGYGNPFDVETDSGNSLAQDFANTVVSGLQAKGIDAHSVTLQTNADSTVALQTLLKGTQEKSLLFTILEWKSDTYQNTALHYNIALEVFDKSGQSLAHTDIHGSDDLRGSFWNPPEHARREVPKAYKRKLEQLLNAPQVEEALQ